MTVIAEKDCNKENLVQTKDKHKKKKRAMTKDAKLLQTMKAYFPNLPKILKEPPKFAP